MRPRWMSATRGLVAVVQPRLVRLEVAMISTRRYTKVVEISEDAANGVCGMIYNTRQKTQNWLLACDDWSPMGYELPHRENSI